MGIRNQSVLLVNPYAIFASGGFPPLSAATVAGITPDEFHVDIWDELVRGPIEPHTELSRKYGVIGISVTFPFQSVRALEIVQMFRQKEILTVLGGAFLTSNPTQFSGCADVLIVGECEDIWPRFLRDWQEGRHRPEYRQITPPDLSHAPPPNWNSIRYDFKDHYSRGSLQTTRGCPFDCEFCDVIYIYGRKQRHKPIEAVISEISDQHTMGVRTVFLADDAFDADPAYAEGLLQGVISLNKSFQRPLAFEVQCGISVARSDKFLTLLADSNFQLLWMGIESPNRDSLININKIQNVCRNLVEDCRKIGSYGIGIAAYMIVGLDEDNADIFDRHIQFWSDASILVPIINILTAIPHTKLWRRLAQEGRLLLTPGAQEGLFDITSNIVPKRLSRKQLIEGYRYLLVRAAEWEFFATRLVAWIDAVERIPESPGRPPGDATIRECRAMLQGGDEARKHFDDLVAYTKREKSSLLGRVLSYLLNHDRRSNTLARNHIPQLSEAIHCKAFDAAAVTKWNIPIPKGFRETFRPRILPSVYIRMRTNLTDETALPEALTKVFTDFLIRFAHEYGEFQESHMRILYEIADKVCAKFNGISPEEFFPKEPGNVVSARAEILNPLADSLIKAIAEDLIRQNRSLHRPERKPNLLPIHLG